MLRAEEFRGRYQCRIYPAAYTDPSLLLAPIALLDVDIPHVRRHTQGHALRNAGRTEEDPLELLIHPGLGKDQSVTAVS